MMAAEFTRLYEGAVRLRARRKGLRLEKNPALSEMFRVRHDGHDVVVFGGGSDGLSYCASLADVETFLRGFHKAS